VGDSILGPETNLGAGTVTANLRHDGEPSPQGSTATRPAAGSSAPSPAPAPRRASTPVYSPA
jgi:bifunctional N-acetylglucosamine-1-phosphate-uridyltransferase/glucosamine-1-phosphate-acetyltransferase GlmU-like protein